MAQELTQARLKELLHYDPETGVFTWRVTKGRIVSGSRAGTCKKSGYCQVRIDYVIHSSHRLAWLYIHGEFPLKHIDHIDRDPSNNRMANLRQCSALENHENCRMYSSNKSGHTGVQYIPSLGGNKPYVVGIQSNYVAHHIGRFETMNEAIVAHAEAKARLHKFNPTLEVMVV